VSETDSFIEEVSEEVRRDKLFALMRKWGWIPISLVILAVGGAAYNEWSKSQARMTAQARGDGIIAALNLDSPAARADALAKISTDAGAAKVLVDLQRAAILLDTQDRDGALEILDRLAGDTGIAQVYRDLARLKAIILRGADMEAEARMAALRELGKPGAPFRVVAMEQQAIALLDAGDRAGAIDMLKRLQEEPLVTPAMRSRAGQMVTSLGGE
jgi:hypothetical protein